MGQSHTAVTTPDRERGLRVLPAYEVAVANNKHRPEKKRPRTRLQVFVLVVCGFSFIVYRGKRAVRSTSWHYLGQLPVSGTYPENPPDLARAHRRRRRL